MNVAYNTLRQENDNTINIVNQLVQPPPPPKEDIPSTSNDQPKLKGKCTKFLNISFTNADKFKASEGPLYISTQIAKYIFFECLVDTTSMVNIITEEHLYAKKHHDFNNTIDTWIQTCNGFLYPLQGSISFLVDLCRKMVYSTFDFIPTSN